MSTVSISNSNATVSFANPQSGSAKSTLSQTSTMLQTDTSGIEFIATVNFNLCNPIYTDDESDLIIITIQLGSTYGGKCYNLTCSLCNLGQMVVSPVYPLQATSSGQIIIPVNKWFNMTAPGSTYQFTVSGILVTSTSGSCACVSN